MSLEEWRTYYRVGYDAVEGCYDNGDEPPYLPVRCKTCRAKEGAVMVWIRRQLEWLGKGGA
jgi:hypothetical protein